MARFFRVSSVWIACFAALVFAVSVTVTKSRPRQTVHVEMQVALPLFVQVVLAAGDRYLAANSAALRAVVADSIKMGTEEFAVLAQVQSDVSWLNPRHEDNYYIAAAILPWNGQYAAAQRILERAMNTRPFDYQPAFYYGFNLLHFQGDAAGASATVLRAAQVLPEGNDRLQMENLGAIWLDKASDLDYAITIVEAMAHQAQRNDFRRYLEQRVERLKGLQVLRSAVVAYRSRYGRMPSSLDLLVREGFLEVLPRDPFGFGYGMSVDGSVFVRNSRLNN